jgi:hypothetical protein
VLVLKIRIAQAGRHRSARGRPHRRSLLGKTDCKPTLAVNLEPRTKPMRTQSHAARSSAALGFLLDELRLAGVTTYADLAATLNRQGLRPARGRWTAHALHLAMRRHRRAHPGALANVGAALYARRAEEARRVIRRLRRRGLKTQGLIARALNARGLTTPGFGHPWTARSVSRVLTAGRGSHPRRSRARAAR